MPSWKRVAVSGSEIAFAGVTASNGILNNGRLTMDGGASPREIIFSNNIAAWQDGRIAGNTLELRSTSIRRLYLNSTGVQLSGSTLMTGSLAITGSLFVSASTAINEIRGGLRIYGSGRWYDGSNSLAIDVENRTLFDSNQSASVDFAQGLLYEPVNSIATVDWTGTRLYDNNGNASMYWGNRNLINANGTTLLNWSPLTGGAILTGTASWASNIVGGVGVTSVATAGTVSGITLTGGTITSTGTITLGGSISGLTTSNLSGTAGITNAQLANSSVTVGSTAISLGGTSTTLAGLTSVTSTNFTGSLQGAATSVTNAVTFNNGGAGDASGTVYNGSAARTISYNTVGAPSTSGTNATGTWGIGISGNAATATTATSASTQTISTNALHYPVFVDADNSSPTAEKLGTDANFNFNPSTNRLSITGSLVVTAGITGSFTGSMFGTLTGTGSFTGSLTGSVFGTASWAENAITASVVTITNSPTLTGPAPILFAANSGSRGVLSDVGVFSYNAIGDQFIVPNISSSGVVIASRIQTNSITGSVTLSGSLAIIGSVRGSGSLEITGSVRGVVVPLSIASLTASVNLATSNAFTLTLANNTTTHITFTNIRPGQTANIRVTQGTAGNGKAAFPTLVKQPSGSAYTGSQVANAIDILSVVTFDSTDVYASTVRRLI